MNHIQIKRTNTIFILRIWTNGSLFFIKMNQLPFSELFARRLHAYTQKTLMVQNYKAMEQLKSSASVLPEDKKETQLGFNETVACLFY